MRDFMALYKFNKVIIEFNCMRLDKHPEVNAGWIDFVKYMHGINRLSLILFIMALIILMIKLLVKH